jgi:fatty acid desaturase
MKTTNRARFHAFVRLYLVRVLFVLFPALVFSAAWFLIDWKIGTAVLWGWFWLGWIITTPRRERGESMYPQSNAPADQTATAGMVRRDVGDYNRGKES